MLGLIEKQSRAERVMNSFADELRRTESIGRRLGGESIAAANVGWGLLRSLIAQAPMERLAKEAQSLRQAMGFDPVEGLGPFAMGHGLADAMKPALLPQIDMFGSDKLALAGRFLTGVESLELNLGHREMLKAKLNTPPKIDRVPNFGIFIPKRRPEIVRQPIELECACAIRGSELPFAAKELEYSRWRIEIGAFCSKCLTTCRQNSKATEGPVSPNVRCIPGNGISDGISRGKLHLVPDSSD